MQAIANNIRGQFTFEMIWQRLGLAVLSTLAVLTAMQHPPHGFMEWIGVCTAIATSVWKPIPSNGGPE